MKKIIFLILIIIVGGIGFLFFFLSSLNEVRNIGSEIEFEVVRGDGVNQISQNLFEQDIINNKFIFESYSWLKGKESKFVAGKYILPEKVSTKDLVVLFTSKINAEEIILQFIEGWTVDDISNYLFEQKLILSKAEFDKWNKVGLWKDEFDFLSDLNNNETLEGYLFPDTYNFYIDADVETIVRKMLETFSIRMNSQLLDDIENSNRSFHEVIMLASIVEKEVKAAEDMKIVADIFLKRLAIGMALQADSTLNYATGGKNSSLTYDELQIDSKYNLYKYLGYPPTPISNPGMNAIRAAIYPVANDYYFFLTSLEGKAYFGKTLDEHKANRKYLK